MLPIRSSRNPNLDSWRRTLLSSHLISATTRRTLCQKLDRKLPQDTPIEEETSPGYEAKDFYPVDPGEHLIGKYQVISKLGWSHTSTVWLARDLKRRIWQSERYVAVKIATRKGIDEDEEDSDYEESLYSHICEANPTHSGYNHVRKLLETFTMESAHGKHPCFAYELLREPLSMFRQRLKGGRLPVDLLKPYLRVILQALDYLHTDCQIIHTDLKEDNILVTIEDPAIISDMIKAQETNPMQWKDSEFGYVYRSHNNFGPIRSSYLVPKIADFDLALSGDVDGLLVHPIQPNAYRAPEVLLGAGWSYSADIWNLGVLMWNLLEKRDLFDQICDGESRYSGRMHLAQMISLLGPPPAALLESAEKASGWRWAPKLENSQGELCDSAVDFYGGPFFNDQGEFLYPELVHGKGTLHHTVLSLEGKEKGDFVDFALEILKWMPQERKTAKDLLDHPWLRIPEHI